MPVRIRLWQVTDAVVLSEAKVFVIFCGAQTLLQLNFPSLTVSRKRGADIGQKRKSYGEIIRAIVAGRGRSGSNRIWFGAGINCLGCHRDDEALGERSRQRFL